MLNQEQSILLMEPHYKRIEEMVNQALTRLRKFDGERHCLRKTSVANIFRDLLVDEARLGFANLESEGVKLIDQNDTSFFIEISGYHRGIEGAIWSRLKKINKNFLTGNIPTKKANAFNEQSAIGYSMQPFLEGEDWKQNPVPLQPHHLNIGHQWNELGTDVRAVVITSPNGKKSISWYQSILGGTDDMDASGSSSDSSNDNISIFPVEIEISTKKPGRISAKENKEKEATSEERKKKSS